MRQAVDKHSPDDDSIPPKAVLWVTNVAAPYRVPVWRHLAMRHKVTVALLESNARLERDARSNRGLDWLHPETTEVTYTELPTWKLRRGESRFYALKSLRPLLNMRQYDVVLFGGWESPAYWSLLLAARLSRIGRVAFYESTGKTMTHPTGLIARARAAFFRSMDVVVVPGEAAAMGVLAMGVSPARVMTGFNAVDVTEFHKVAQSPAAHDPQNSPIGHNYLYVGQLISRKRVECIIHAFSRIASANDELTIVGEGPLRHEVSVLAEGITGRVRLVEQVKNSEMPTIMACNHTLILASQREVWGLVVNEALASGMHVVVAENCGVVPSVRRMAGVFVVEQNLQNLTDKMKESRESWNGRIAEPVILEHTPERFASVFESAFNASHEAKIRSKATK